MAELSPREHEILDIVFYLRNQLAVLLPEEQAVALEEVLSSLLDDVDEPLTPTLVTGLLQEIRTYEPVRAQVEQLSGTYLLQYVGPAQPTDEGPDIPLGEQVMCLEEGHDGNDPYVTRLRKHGQRCPVHNVFLIPIKEEGN